MDRLFEEAQLRADVAAQLATAQEREAQARQDAEEAHGMFEDLSTRSKLDGEEIARLQKERDELLQKNVVASEKASELLAELQIERDLKLKAKERSAMLQEKANQDALVVNRAIRERDEARQEAEACQADLGVEVT